MYTIPQSLDADRALDFLDFVSERHKIWERRQKGEAQPWTDHPILATRKFTNVFRILDWDSQWLVRNLVDASLDPRDQLMRLFLFRHTGRREAWEYHELMHDAMPDVEHLDQTLETFKQYRGSVTTTIRGQEARNKAGGVKQVFDNPVFTSAYLVFPQSTTPGTDKLESIVALARRLFHPDSPDDIMPDWLAARSQAERFVCLRRNKGVADFMSMQVLTDWGYTPQCGHDREHEFIQPGPGAVKGAAALAPVDRTMDVLIWAQHAILAQDDIPALPLPGGGVRWPSLMDVQNCLCEFSKLVRYQGQPLSKPYVPAHSGPQPLPDLPYHF